MAKKKRKKYWTNKLDGQVSKMVRSRGSCEKCGMTDYSKLQCCHIFSRTYRNTRWDFLNLLCLCAGCHRWGHNCPTLFTEFVKDRLGEELYDELNQRHNQTKIWKEYELEEMFDRLKQQFEEAY